MKYAGPVWRCNTESLFSCRFTNNTFVTATDRKATLGLDNFEKTYRVGAENAREINVSQS